MLLEAGLRARDRRDAALALVANEGLVIQDGKGRSWAHPALGILGSTWRRRANPGARRGAEQWASGAATRSSSPQLEASMRSFLLYGDYERAGAARPAGSVGFVGLGLLLLCGLEHRKFWFQYRDELLAKAAPDLPWGYYEFEHPELRPAPEAADDEAADLDDEGEPAL